jgi:hypothetical protein
VWATKISLGQDAVQADVTEVRLLLETWEDEIWFESDMQRWIDLSNRELRRMHQELGEEGAAHDPDRWMFLPDTSEVR